MPDTPDHARSISAFLAAAADHLALMEREPGDAEPLPFPPETGRAVLNWLGRRIMTGEWGR